VLPASKLILCYVTDRRSLPGGAHAPESEATLLATIERAAAAGVNWIQLREKDLTGRRLAALARHAVSRVPPGARILVNDRLDVALAAGAGGVHLGEDSLHAEEVVGLLRSEACREAATEDFLVGVSTHSGDAARAAEQAGASYIFFGPVFETPSKAAYGAPQGIDRLADVCRQVRIPILAIGGITAQNAGGCFKAGAAGIAAIRLFQEASDLQKVVSLLRSAPLGAARTSR
jgi:thiamine-phosphate pyrophosphorylase